MSSTGGGVRVLDQPLASVRLQEAFRKANQIEGLELSRVPVAKFSEPQAFQNKRAPRPFYDTGQYAGGEE